MSASGALRPSLAAGHRFGRWLEVDPEVSARSALEEACLLEQVGKTDQAIDLLGEALGDDRDSAPLLLARGALYLSGGFPRAAAGDFQRACELKPESPRCWFALGHAYEILQLSNQALKALEVARERGGQDAGLFLSLARVNRSAGHRGASARHYERALEQLEWNSSEIFVEVMHFAIEDPKQAIDVENLRERLDTCRGAKVSDDAWLLRALLRELPGEPAEEVRATFRRLEVPAEELRSLTRGLLETIELLDPETGPAAWARLLDAEPDEQRRATLERCLSGYSAGKAVR